MIWHWFLHVTGTSNETGPWYAFWSGFGSDLGELAIIGGLVGLFRKHNCHDKGCWRIGKHTVDGTPWCSKHHEAARDAVAPAQPVTLNFHGGVDAAKVGEEVRKAVRRRGGGAA